MPFLECATKIFAETEESNPEDFKAKSDKWRMDSLKAIKEVCGAHHKPPVSKVADSFIVLLYALPVHDRLYVQRAMRPLSQKYKFEDYWTELSTALQEIDLWVDINILTDRERKAEEDQSIEIMPDFKLP